MKKKIGILGLGSYSTLFYIREINALFNEAKKGYSTFPFKMLNSNFDEINNLLPNTSSKLDKIVKDYIDELIEMDIKAVLVPNITLHETIDRLQFEIPLIHPFYSTLKELKKTEIKKVILFGTIHTMKSTYLKPLFEENNI